MINIITGKPGSGKTYILAKKIKEFLAKKIEVYTNIPKINSSSPYLHHFVEFDELIPVRNGIIVIDEAQIFLNCRQWEQLSPIFQYKLQQHRKHGLDIWGAVQSVNRLDVVIRELIHNYYEVRKIGTGEGAKRPFGIFIMTQFDPMSANKVRRSLLGMELILMKKEICQFYDTMADLGFTETKEDIVNIPFKVCPECGHKKPLYLGKKGISGRI
jgi:hypothetical protein